MLHGLGATRASTKLSNGEDGNDELVTLFELLALERVRVPASRDVTEAKLSNLMKKTMHRMHANGRLLAANRVAWRKLPVADFVAAAQAFVDLVEDLDALCRESPSEAMGLSHGALGLRG